MLAFIGKHMNVNRVYIFENNDDNTACSLYPSAKRAYCKMSILQ